MSLLDPEQRCPECSKRYIDVGEEFVCPGCGATREKQVIEAPFGRLPRPRDSVRQFLGSYMGSRADRREVRSARGITGNSDGYEHIKAVSDFAGRKEDAAVDCARLIERVGERLFIPRVVLIEAVAMAKEVLAATKGTKRRVTVATVSAHALISACRVDGATGVNVREIMDAHLALGRRLSSSSIIQLALESPLRTAPRTPREYIPRVLGRLTLDNCLSGVLARDGISAGPYLSTLHRLAVDLLDLAEATEMSGKRPCVLAASAVYSAEVVLAAREGRKRRVTQRRVAECVGASEYTVREQCASIFAAAISRHEERMKLLPPLPSSR